MAEPRQAAYNPSAHECFRQHLDDSGRTYGVILDAEFASDLYQACHRRRRGGLKYRQARNQVLEDAWFAGGIADEDELAAYKDFIDRHSSWKANEVNRLKNLPFAPR